MKISQFLWDSFYIKAGKKNFYIKSFDSGKWIRCKSEFEVNEDGQIHKIFIDSTNLNQIKEKPTQVYTQRVNPFDHPRTVLHEFEIAERFIRHLIQLFKISLWTSTQTFIFQLDYAPEGGITDIELRAIRDSLEQSGAKKVYVIKPDISVSERKVDSLYQKISQQRFHKRTKLSSEWRSLYL